MATNLQVTPTVAQTAVQLPLGVVGGAAIDTIFGEGGEEDDMKMTMLEVFGQLLANSFFMGFAANFSSGLLGTIAQQPDPTNQIPFQYGMFFSQPNLQNKIKRLIMPVRDAINDLAETEAPPS